VFSYERSGVTGSVTGSVTDNGTGDENADVGEVCVPVWRSATIRERDDTAAWIRRRVSIGPDGDSCHRNELH
jgi:hypothetical protein